MYLESRRESLLDYLTEISKATDGIQGLIQVGSGAYGYRDQYSDLDVVVVVKESTYVPNVHDELIRTIGRNFAVLTHKVYRHEPDIYVSCFLLADYLELDLGIWSFTKLRATKPNWKVIYETDVPSIEERLQSTIPTEHVDIEKTATDSMSIIWQFVRGATVALLRGNWIKAFKETEVIRDKVAELIAQREGILHDVAKEIGQVKSNRVHALIETYRGDMNYKGLHANLVATVQLYFEVVSEILGREDTETDYRLAMDMVKSLTAHS